MVLEEDLNQMFIKVLNQEKEKEKLEDSIQWQAMECENELKELRFELGKCNADILMTERDTR